MPRPPERHASLDQYIDALIGPDRTEEEQARDGGIGDSDQISRCCRCQTHWGVGRHMNAGRCDPLRRQRLTGRIAMHDQRIEQVEQSAISPALHACIGMIGIGVMNGMDHRHPPLQSAQQQPVGGREGQPLEMRNIRRCQRTDPAEGTGGAIFGGLDQTKGLALPQSRSQCFAPAKEARFVSIIFRRDGVS